MASTTIRRSQQQNQQQRSRSVSTSRRKGRRHDAPLHRSNSSTLPASSRGTFVRNDRQASRGDSRMINDAQMESSTPPKSPKPFRARGSRGRGGRRKKAQKGTATDTSVASSGDFPQEDVKTDTSVNDDEKSSKTNDNVESRKPSVVLVRHEEGQVQTKVSIKETVGYDYNSVPGLQRSRTFSSEMSVSTCGSARITTHHVRDNSEDLKGLAILDDGSPTMIEGEMFATSSYDSYNAHSEMNRSRTSSYSSSYGSRSRASSYEYNSLRPETTSLAMPAPSNFPPSDYSVLPPMHHATGQPQCESRFLAASDFPMEHGDVYGFDAATANADFHPLRNSSSSESVHLPPRGHHRQRSFTDPSHDVEQKWMHEQRQIQHDNATRYDVYQDTTADPELESQLNASAHPFLGNPGNANRARTLSDPCGGIKNTSRNEMESIRKQREMMPAGGSLFNISPRSFLMGKNNSFDFVDA